MVEPTLPEAGHLAGPVDQRSQGAELRAVVCLATFMNYPRALLLFAALLTYYLEFELKRKGQE